MKRPMIKKRDINDIAAEVVVAGESFTETTETEVTSSDGLIETTEEVETSSDGLIEIDEEEDLDPLPSEPVQETVVELKAADSLHYMGSFVMDGMLGRAGITRAASIPVLVKNSGVIYGVLVISDIGQFPIIGEVEAAKFGLTNVTCEYANQQTRPVVLAVARLLAGIKTDSQLDISGCLINLNVRLSDLK